MTDLTVAEIQTEAVRLKAKAGRKSDITIYINSGSVYVTVYPHGIAGSGTQASAIAETAREAISKAEAIYDAMASRLEAETIKKMALFIVRQTFEMGECTDAAIRSEFSAEELERHGEEATATADKMAEGGPFSIIKLQAAANAA